MTAAPRSAMLAVAVVLLAMFAVAAHLSIVGGASRSIGAWMSLAPFAAIAVGVVRRPQRHRYAPVAVLVAAALAAAAALWLAWPLLERNFPDLLFVEHAGAYAALAFVFGRTLVDGREPLCTRFARIVHGTLPPDVERYTRKVTVAWTLFFVAVCAVACALYAGGFIAAWSLLATLLSPLLIGVMFAVEYVVRQRALPAWKHTGILTGIGAFARHFGTAQPEPRR